MNFNLGKTIFTGFSPNSTGREARKALSFLFFPFFWLRLWQGNANEKVIFWLRNFFQSKKVFLYDSGRSALFCGLRALDIKEGDHVLVQAYTCVVVVNAIKFLKAIPIYVDIDNSFNLDVNDLKKKISKQTKAIIIQHTFGTPANIEKILEISKKYNLSTVEDCAHSFGATYQGKLTGTYADIGMFSFGSDKILSCVRGGALITNNESIYKKLEKLNLELKPLTRKILIQHLLHYPIFYLGKLFYSIYLGKIILYLSKKFNIINRSVYPLETKGKKIKEFPCLLPNSLAELLLNQLLQAQEINKHRQKIAEIYHLNINNNLIKKPIFDKDSIFLRYTIRVNDPIKLHNFAKQHRIILGDWYNQVVAPRNTDMGITYYVQGSCPNAEKIASESINLPTNRNIKKEDAEKIANLINQYQ